MSDTDGGAGFHAKTIYQVYPKSFYDSTGNGVGDLRGVIEKVDYIASLGVDMVWFNPFFASPQVDNGYDIADYCSVDPSMGTMADFDELVAALEARGIGVMLDMVLNHTSTAHEWFQRALSGDPEYQDFYYLRPGGANGELPNNWVSKFGGPAWARFGDSDLYYLHLFDRTQADLNWHNPRVRHELAEVVEFWRLKGVRGFRFDVINLIGKPIDLPSAPDGVDDRGMYTDGETVTGFLGELARASYATDQDSITVGEMSSTSIERCIEYSHSDRGALGGFNWSSQHLIVEVLGGEFEEAVAGVAGWCTAAVGGGSGVAAGDAVAGAAGAVAGGAARVLAVDCDRCHDGRGVGGRGCVVAGRRAVVPSRWRDATR